MKVNHIVQNLKKSSSSEEGSSYLSVRFYPASSCRILTETW